MSVKNGALGTCTERLALTCAEHLDLLRLRSVQVVRWNRSRGSAVVPLAYGTLRERGSKLRVASCREGSR
ncbi:hypothetical protein [Nostoc sp. ChiQUE02]|uniref:hypothetical protein n=1 Tax=Nostoc sp. ChiQUE02 TaxID=3075377 RepID=UPI003D161793